MEPGDIIFTRPKSWIFNIIRRITKGEYGHVCIVTHTISKHIFITEALPSGVDVNDWIWHKMKDEDYIVYRNTKASYKEIKKFIRRTVEYHGTPYDKIALLNFIIGRTCFGTDKAVYCSELAYRVLYKYKLISTEFQTNPEKISPKMLRDILEADEDWEVVDKKD